MALYSRVWLSLQGLYAPTPHPQLQPRHTTDPGAIIKLVETDQGLLLRLRRRLRGENGVIARARTGITTTRRISITVLEA
jgi:hypothetical protein